MIHHFSKDTKFMTLDGGISENLLEYIHVHQEVLVKSGALPENSNLEAHRELVRMQTRDVPHVKILILLKKDRKERLKIAVAGTDYVG